jgi:hypothetical protein
MLQVSATMKLVQAVIHRFNVIESGFKPCFKKDRNYDHVDGEQVATAFVQGWMIELADELATEIAAGDHDDEIERVWHLEGAYAAAGVNIDSDQRREARKALGRYATRIGGYLYEE